MKKLNDALAANLYVSEDDPQAYRNQVERAKIRYVHCRRINFPSRWRRRRARSRPSSRLTGGVQAPEQRDLAYLLVGDAQLASQVNPAEQVCGAIRRPQDRVPPG